MQNSKREKILMVTILGLGLTALLCRWTVSEQSAYGKKRNLVTTLRAELADQEVELRKITQARNRLKRARAQSLSSDLPLAATEYQRWLLGIGEALAITEFSVLPQAPLVQDSIGHRIPFHVRADVTSLQLGGLLDRFYGVPIMHRIEDLSVRSLGDPTSKSGLRRVNLKIGVLVVRGVKQSANLQPLDNSKRSRNSRDQLSIAEGASSSLQQHFEKRDPFLRFKSEPPPAQTVLVSTPTPRPQPTPVPRPAPKPQPKINPLSSVKLVGTFAKAGEYQAWLFDDQLKKEYSAVAGESIAIAETEYRIKTIGVDFVDFQTPSGVRRLNFGETMERIDFAGTTR